MTKPPWLKQTIKWTRRPLKVVAVAVALILAFQVLVLPSLIRYAVHNALAGLGLDDVTFRVRGASFWQAALANVRVGTRGPAHVGNIGVDYSPVSLLHGRVHTIWVDGAEVQAIVKDGQVDLGPLAIKRVSSSGGELPFDRLELRASTLALDWEGRRLWVPMQGTLLNQGQGRLRLDTLIRIQGGQVQVAASYDPAADRLDVAAAADDLDAAALATAVPPRYAGVVPSVSTGLISAKATYVQTRGSAKLTAATNAQGVRFGANVGQHRLWVQDLNWTAAIALDGGFNVTDATASATARRITFDGEPASNVILTASKKDRRLVLELKARGENWLLRSLQASVGGAFAADHDAPFTLDATVGLDSEIPEQLAAILAMHRLDVIGLGAISLDGRVTASARQGVNGAWLWDASTKQMRVLLNPGDLSISKDLVVLRGLSGVARLSAEADNHHADITIVPGSNVWLDSLDQKASPIKLQKAANKSLAALAIDTAPAKLFLSFDHPNEVPWTLDIPAVSLSIPQLSVSTAAAKIHDLETVLRLHIRASPAQIDVFARDGSYAGFQSLQAALGADTLSIGAWKLLLASAPDQPLVHVSTADAHSPPRLSLRAQSDGPLTINAPGADATVNSLALSAAATVDARSNPSIQATLSLGGVSGQYKPAAVRLTDVSGHIPISWNAPSTQPGELHISSVQIADTTYPAVTGALSVADTRSSFQLDWPIIKDVARVMAEGFVDFGGRQPHGQITATLPPFTLKDEAAIASLIKPLKDYGISGTLGATASIRFDGPVIRPLVSLTMKDVAIASKEHQRSVQGLNGTVSLDSLSPLTTPGGQKLSVKAAHIGKLSFTQGVLTFRIENSTVFHVEDTDWGWAGGRAHVNSFRFDLNKPRIDLVASGHKLSLAQILNMVGQEQLTGEGTLYGRLPVTVTWPQTKKDGRTITQWSQPVPQFGEGFVYATPGGGHLRMADPETTVGALLEKQNPAFAKGGKMEPVKSSLMGALRDLQYSVLMMDFIRQDDELLARLHVAGKGANAQEIAGLTVNIRPFDAILRDIMIIRREISFGD